MILSACADLTIEEIYKAFELERYGSYELKTDHYGLFNAEYVAAVIKNTENGNLIHKGNTISPPQSGLPEISDSEKQEIVITE
jgi:hypothetical protein